MIKCNDIHLTLGNHTILRGISCHIEAGAVTALIGPNGSGKSSLLSVLSGLQSATQGSCLLDVKQDKTPRNYSEMSRAEFAQHIALLPQRNPVPASLTVGDLVAFGRHPHRPWYRNLSQHDKKLIDWAMTETGIMQYQNRPLTQLSGGELQRCWLAMVLAQDTPILMLDEPTSWLDVAHQISLLEIVRRLNKHHNKTVVWVLHDLNQASAFSDNAILLQEGQVVAAGTCSNVINADIISNVYDTQLAAHQINGNTVLWPTYAAQQDLLQQNNPDINAPSQQQMHDMEHTHA